MLEGVKTFRSASTGRYKSSSNDVEKLKEGLRAMPTSISKYKKNLYEDRKKIAQDVRNAFDKIVTTNG